MCGIAGFVGDTRDVAEADDRLQRMCAAIRHRGPDDEGRYVIPGVALGMRRLSIIDVAGGHQPIANEDGTVVVVFNGEIYNHHALRAELRRQGHQFRTSSDTETLVHLYEQHGEKMLQFLRGMFGFAIWDARRGQLFVARDRIGIKPMYYWPRGEGLAFGSELRPFLAVPDFPRELSPDAVAEFLAFGYVPERSCIFSAARKLPPGHYLVWKRGEPLRVNRYWTPVCAERTGDSDEDLVRELRERLEECVCSHLESEVPLGAFLSGGVDSSTVVAIMARHSSRPVSTFAIGFGEEEYNEAPHAAAVARALGTQHTELVLRPDADALVDSVASTYDEPFADSSALPTMLVSQLARRHVTVSLSGDGGDELFAGYTRYAEVAGGLSVPSGMARAILGSVAGRLPHGFRGRNRLLDLARNARGRYGTTVALPLSDRDGGAVRDDVAALLPSFEHLLSPWFDEAQAAGRDFLAQMTLVDMLTYLPGDILTKVDRASMAASLEARVPLLDHTLIEFAAALPSAVKLRDRQGKWILRRAVKDLVPPEVLTKPKQGFAVPLKHWFRGPLRGRLDELASPHARIAQYVNAHSMTRLVSEHLRERRDHMGRLWRLLAFERWLAALERGALARPNEPTDIAHAIVERAVAVV